MWAIRRSKQAIKHLKRLHRNGTTVENKVIDGKPPKFNPSDYIEFEGFGSEPGDIVRAMREMLELSQAELADMTGMTQSAISAIERGTSKLGVDHAVALADAFDCYPGILLFPNWKRKKAE